MEPVAVGDLVTVTGSGRPLEGLVVELPSRTKTIVAVVDPKHGPVFRTVNPETLSPREQASRHDAALRLLVRRRPGTARGSGASSGGGGQGAAGFKRGASHRPTGR